MSNEIVRKDPGEKVIHPVGVQAEGTTTSLACYFSNGKDTTWYWGLNNDDSYYKLNGSWFDTPYTKLKKFSTTTDVSEITRMANNAKSYYKLDNYTLIGIFAADSSTGYNYPIVSGERELFPRY